MGSEKGSEMGSGSGSGGQRKSSKFLRLCLLQEAGSEEEAEVRLSAFLQSKHERSNASI